MKVFDDPNVIVDIFRRRNLTPKTGRFVGDVERGECCILTALYCDAKGCESPRECFKEIDEAIAAKVFRVADKIIAPAVGLDPGYASAMMESWDDEDASGYESDNEARRLGYAHGRAARKACEAAGMMPPLKPGEDREEFDDEFDDEDYDDEEEE